MMPNEVAQIRMEICLRNKCPVSNLDYYDPCANCPEGHWSSYSFSGCDEEGLGDKIERIAKPIARTIDKILGTRIANCKGCKKRRKILNERFPLQSKKT